MSCNYWSYSNCGESNDAESRNHAPSPFWPNPASLATGFLEISPETAIAYWMAQLRVEVEDEDNQIMTTPSTQSFDSAAASDDKMSDKDVPKDRRRRRRSRDEVTKKDFKISRKTSNDNDLTLQRQMVSKTTWTGYTLFESNGIPTALVLPRAFSRLSAHKLQASKGKLVIKTFLKNASFCLI